jgi:replicative DNA helicase
VSNDKKFEKIMENNFILPYDADAERQVLGAIIQADEVEEDIFYYCDKEDFYTLGGSQVFKAITELKKLGKPLDYFVIMNHLQEKEQLEAQAIHSYLIGSHHSPEVAKHFLNKLKQKAFERKLILLGNKISALGEWNSKNKDRDSHKDINLLQAEIDQLYRSLETGKTEEDCLDSNQLFLEIKKEIPENSVILPGITTGFGDLNYITGGLQKSNLILIAGRPGMGKTAFAINSILRAADELKNEDGCFIFYSMEQSIQQIAFRCLSIIDGNITPMNLRRGNLTKEKREEVMTLADKLRKLPVLWYNVTNRDYNFFENRVRKQTRDRKILGVFIDHLGQFYLPNYQNKYNETSEIATRLQAFCREINIPIISLLQLSRKVEERTDKIPTIADLRESGRLEEVAWIILLLYRDDYYNAESKTPGELTVIVGKNREGATGKVQLKFNKKSLRIYEEIIERKETENYDTPY